MSEKQVLPYNFKGADRISKYNPLAPLIHDRFARNVSSSMSASLRTVVEVALENITQIPYSSFLNNVSDPTCYASISMKPLVGTAALEIVPNLAFPMIDRLLGGVGRPMTNPRPMTEIEQKIIQGVLKLIVDTLRESWRQVYTIEFSVAGIETHPHIVQITAPNQRFVHFEFQVRLKDALSKMHIAIPTLLLEPILHLFDQEESSRRKVIHDSTLLHLLRTVPVNVSIGTVETLFPMQALLSLQVGDTVVNWQQRQESPVITKVAGKSKMYAKARMDATCKAFRDHGKRQG